MLGLNIADGKAVIVMGDPGEVDCALSMSVKDFKKLLVRKIKFKSHLYDGETQSKKKSRTSIKA